MLPIKPSTKALIGLVSVAVAMLVVCGFMYSNRASRLRVLQAQVRQKQQELADGEQIAKRLSVAEQSYLDAQAKLGALEKGVSTRAYVPTLLKQVEELGEKVNLHVVGVRPKAPEVKPQPPVNPEDKDKKAEVKQPDPYDKLDIDIEINGRYWDVVRFLYEITSFPKIIAVKDLQMAPIGQPEEAASPILSVRLSTTAFILKDLAPRTTSEKPRGIGADVKRT